MKIWMATSECSPWAKTGGLGDAVSALARELASRGHDIRVFIPGYASINRTGFGTPGQPLSVQVGSARESGELRSVKTPEGVTLTLVESGKYYNRPGVYGEHGADYPDNDRRFTFFSRAVAELAAHDQPEILHCHDWQTGLIPFFVRNVVRFGGPRPGTVFTVHNAGYQGSFPLESLEAIALGSEETGRYLHGGPLEFYGRFNFLKAGLMSCDAANTVSPTHAKETCTEALGFGLDGVFRSLGGNYTGILNGIDVAEWNPESDRYLTASFSGNRLSGKQKLKTELLAQFALNTHPGEPLIGIVSRLVWQKGIDLFLEAASGVIGRGTKLAVLGSGETATETTLEDLARRYPDRVGLRIGYNDALAHLITAASDILLVPSRYEPCGLVQMQAMRYGTLPVASRTGGLADTIIDFHENPDAGTGFLFSDISAAALGSAIQRATDTYRNDSRGWLAAQQRSMARDFSWGHAAASYEVLYLRVKQAPAGKP